MDLSKAAARYKGLRPYNVAAPQYRHLLLLIFWPMFGLLFWAVERGPLSDREYFPVECSLDSLIPFCELFLIPYLYWFLSIFGISIYTLLFDTEAFRRFMWFLIVTYCTAMAIYLLFPTCQQLRPEQFPRDNFLTRFMAGFYRFDTHTNVCPSLHVLGAFGVMYAGLDAKGLGSFGHRVFLVVSTALVCLSTVMLKQHSLVDLLAALPIALCAYLLIYKNPRRFKDTCTTAKAKA